MKGSFQYFSNLSLSHTHQLLTLAEAISFCLSHNMLEALWKSSGLFQYSLGNWCWFWETPGVFWRVDNPTPITVWWIFFRESPNLFYFNIFFKQCNPKKRTANKQNAQWKSVINLQVSTCTQVHNHSTHPGDGNVLCEEFPWGKGWSLRRQGLQGLKGRGKEWRRDPWPSLGGKKEKKWREQYNKKKNVTKNTQSNFQVQSY